MRIGVVSDPHGCLVGLIATLDWLEKKGVDIMVCAGDIANFGPQPNECIFLLAERKIASAQGNCDRDILLPSPIIQNTDERTTQIAAINDWWRDRKDVEILNVFVSPSHLKVNLLNKKSKRIQGFVLQLCLPKKYKANQVLIENKLIENVEVWDENNYSKIMVPVNLDSGTSQIKIVTNETKR